MESFVTIRFDSQMERMERLRQAMSPNVRGQIVPLVTRRVFRLIQGHFREYAQSHHASADRLGAPHTKHMERAARNMSHTASANLGKVELCMAGIGRALHDVDIHMGDRRLTIPIAKESYGKSAAEMGKRFGEGNLFFFRSKKGSLILAAHVGAKGGKGRKSGGAKRVTLPLYVLKESVHQKRDAAMLPKQTEISEEARDALTACIEQYLRE